MEISTLDAVLFAGAFVLLFFVPGHLLLKRRPIEEKFIVSSGISFIVALVLSETIGLNIASMLLFGGVAVAAISAYRAANP